MASETAEARPETVTVDERPAGRPAVAAGSPSTSAEMALHAEAMNGPMAVAESSGAALREALRAAPAALWGHEPNTGWWQRVKSCDTHAHLTARKMMERSSQARGH